MAIDRRRRDNAINLCRYELMASDCEESALPGFNQLRQQEQHEKKLQDIREQVASGKLVIRKMTPEERKRFPPRERSARGGKPR